MLKLTKTGIGLLTRQYRSVLKKCWMINVGLYSLLAPAVSLTTATAVAVTAAPSEAGANPTTQAAINYGGITPSVSGASKSESEDVQPTLNKIKPESVSVIDGTHGQYALVTTATGAAGEQMVMIGGTQYYYTPNEGSAEQNAKLVNLVNTGGAAMVAGDENDYVFSYNNGTTTTYYKYDKTKLPTSVYKMIESDKQNYTVTNGDKYYNISLNIEQMGTTPTANHNKNWTVNDVDYAQGPTFNTTSKKATGTVEMKESGRTNYYTYTYTTPSDYASQGRKSSQTSSINGGYFYNRSTSTNGGAMIISATSNVNTITADFIKNYASSTNSNDSHGGAIYFSPNSSKTVNLGSIKGNFIGNFASGVWDETGDYYSTAFGGAIYYNGNGDNKSSIGEITGDFIGNSAYSPWDAYAGAIYLGGYAKIGNITGDFIGNSAGTDEYSAAMGYGRGDAYGGAIYVFSNAQIGNIKGNFIGNSVSGQDVYGAAIDSYGSIDSIAGDFIGNSATAFGGSDGYTGSIQGGVIYSYGKIGSIVGDFIGNSAQVSVGEAGVTGGVIHLSGGSSGSNRDGNLTGNFIGNSVQSTSGGQGGVIYDGISNSTMNISDSSFIGNSVRNTGVSYYQGGVINHSGYHAVLNISNSSFVGNSAQNDYYNLYGGVIRQNGSYGTVNISNSSFVGNSAVTSDITYKETVDDVTEEYSYNGPVDGGVISNEGSNNMNIANSSFIGNSVRTTSGYVYGGVIYNSNYSGYAMNISDSVFRDNVTTIETSGTDGLGGAIYNDMSSSIINFSGNNTFTNNYLVIAGAKKPNDIYNKGTINILDGTTTLNSGYTAYSYSTPSLNIAAGATFDLNENNGRVYTTQMGKAVVESGGVIRLGVDLGSTNSSKDTFNFASGSSGRVIVDAVNFTSTLPTATTTYAILSGTTTNITLEVDPVLSAISKTLTVTPSANYWSDTVSYDATANGFSASGKSLVYNVGLASTITDGLMAINTSAADTSENAKTFTATSASEVYNATVSPEATKNKVIVSGVLSGDAGASDTTRSIMNLDNNTGFSLNDSEAELTLKNLQLQGSKDYAVRLNDVDALLNIENSIINDGGISGAAGTVNYYGVNTVNAPTSLSGTSQILSGATTFNNAITDHTISLGSSNSSDPVTMKLGSVVQADGKTTYGSLDNTDVLVNYANDSILDTRNQHSDANKLSQLDLQGNTLKWMLDANIFGSAADTMSANAVTSGVLKLDTIDVGDMASVIQVQLTDDEDIANKIVLSDDYQLEGSMANFVDSVSYADGILSFTTKPGGGEDQGRIHGLVEDMGDGTYTYHTTDMGDIVKPYANLAIGTTVEEDFLSLNSVIGGWNANDRTLESGNVAASHLVNKEISKEPGANNITTDTTSVGANLVRLDTAILEAEDKLNTDYYTKLEKRHNFRGKEQNTSLHRA